MNELDRPQFSVAVFYADGTHDYMVRLVRVERAARVFQNMVASAELSGSEPTEKIIRVIITDGGDCTAREWTHGKGITIP